MGQQRETELRRSQLGPKRLRECQEWIDLRELHHGKEP